MEETEKHIVASAECVSETDNLYMTTLVDGAAPAKDIKIQCATTAVTVAGGKNLAERKVAINTDDKSKTEVFLWYCKNKFETKICRLYRTI